MRNVPSFESDRVFLAKYRHHETMHCSLVIEENQYEKVWFKAGISACKAKIS